MLSQEYFFTLFEVSKTLNNMIEFLKQITKVGAVFYQLASGRCLRFLSTWAGPPFFEAEIAKQLQIDGKARSPKLFEVDSDREKTVDKVQKGNQSISKQLKHDPSQVFPSSFKRVTIFRHKKAIIKLL